MASITDQAEGEPRVIVLCHAAFALHSGAGMRAKVNVAVGILAALAIVTACFAGPLTDRVIAVQRLRTSFSEVDVSDGIQKDEADLIASEYTRLLLGPAGACSGTNDPTFSDGKWRAEILFGFGGEPSGQSISVDRNRGGVSAPGHPTYESFDAFRSARLFDAMVRGR